MTGDSGRILVVEDDRDLCSLLCELLADYGYVAEGVHSGTAALEAVAARRPDAVVLDVMLPEMNGFEVCKRLKMARQTNNIPVVMLTSLDARENRIQGLKLGADRYLTKPFDPDALVSTLREVLGRSRDAAAGRAGTALRIELQSDSRFLEQLNDMLTELFLLTPLADADINRIRYAILEMVENAIEWGNKRQPDLQVNIAYEVQPDRLRVVITDEGPGFNPTDIAHAADGVDPVRHMTIREKLGIREGGFGILIAKGMVDSLEYNERGNQVTLVKKFAPAGTPPAAT